MMQIAKPKDINQNFFRARLDVIPNHFVKKLVTENVKLTVL